MPDHDPDRQAVDLFAGPGGWDLAAMLLGFHPLGIEWDDAACATRRAAGLRTLQADVSALDPVQVVREILHAEQLWGLIGSPPCQGFSGAGLGLGRAALDAYASAMRRMAAGQPVDREWLDAQCADERAHLVLEPLRWALACRPRWIALEQVKEVQPLWDVMAEVLRGLGYSVWTGVLWAERYGVPQTRKRAILLASLDVPVKMPAPTHRGYYPSRRSVPQEEGLFEIPAGRAQRPEEDHLKPWISMAVALGWREGVTLDHHRGAGMIERHGDRTPRTTSQPAPAVTAGGSRWEGGPRWTLDEDPRPTHLVANNQTNATVRSVDEPAPTIMSGHSTASRRWIVDTGNTRGGSRPEGRARDVDDPAPTVTTRADQLEWRDDDDVPVAYDSRGQRNGRTGAPNRKRSVDEPAPTIAVESRNDSWVFDRPATTVQCDPRVWPPGHKVNADDERAGREGYGDRAGTNAIRVTVEEAAILQSFPPGYPWQGPKGKQFEQVGNAVPPRLAHASLCVVVDPQV